MGWVLHDDAFAIHPGIVIARQFQRISEKRFWVSAASRASAVAATPARILGTAPVFVFVALPMHVSASPKSFQFWEFFVFCFFVFLFFCFFSEASGECIKSAGRGRGSLSLFPARTTPSTNARKKSFFSFFCFSRPLARGPAPARVSEKVSCARHIFVSHFPPFCRLTGFRRKRTASICLSLSCMPRSIWWTRCSGKLRRLFSRRSTSTTICSSRPFCRPGESAFCFWARRKTKTPFAAFSGAAHSNSVLADFVFCFLFFLHNWFYLWGIELFWITFSCPVMHFSIFTVILFLSFPVMYSFSALFFFFCSRRARFVSLLFLIPEPLGLVFFLLSFFSYPAASGARNLYDFHVSSFLLPQRGARALRQGAAQPLLRAQHAHQERQFWRPRQAERAEPFERKISGRRKLKSAAGRVLGEDAGLWDCWAIYTRRMPVSVISIVFVKHSQRRCWGVDCMHRGWETFLMFFLI